jgi:predicted PurR-regulated permease PerM
MSKYLFPFVIAVAIYSFFTNYDSTVGMFGRIISWVSYIAGRLIIGFGCAYVLDMLVRWLTNKLRFKRWVAIIVAYLAFFGFIAFMLVYLIPMIGESITQIVSVSSQLYNDIPRWVTNLTERLSLDPELTQSIIEAINDSYAGFTELLTSLGKNINYNTIFNFLSSTSRVMIDWFFGLVISAYVLIEKKRLIRQSRKLTYALCKTDTADRLIRFTRRAHHIFSRYITGKMLDSAFVMVLSMILYAAFRIPLWPFMGMLAGVCNLIPYFGPLVGGVVSCLIMMCFEPIHVLIVLIIIIGVQTLDSWIVEPKILGDAVGTSPLIIIVAVMIGGNLLGGFMGMFLSVPLAAILKTLIYDGWAAKRIEARRKLRSEELAAQGVPQPFDDVPIDINTLIDEDAERVRQPKKEKKPKAPTPPKE